MSKRQPDANLVLVQKMGSKRGYDPMPPDQYEWQRAKGNPMVLRIWSELCRCTVGARYVDNEARRSWYATEDDGETPLTMPRLAKRMKEDLPNVSRGFREGTELGIFGRDGTRLLLLGEVKVGDFEEAKKKRSAVCTGQGEAYISYQIKKLKISPEEQEKLWAEVKIEDDLEASMVAAAVAAIRIICTPRKDSRFSARGIVRKHVVPKAGKPKPETPPLVSALLPVLEQHVQTTFAFEAVQDTGGDAYKREETGEAVSVGRALPYNREKLQRESLPAAAAALSEEVAELARGVGFGPIEAAAAKNLLAECRNVNPEITVEEIKKIAWNKLRQNRDAKIRSPLGFVLKIVPPLCAKRKGAST